MRALIGALLIAAFVTPALAADEFYVVQDVKTKKCETGMKTVKVCTTN